MVLVMSSLEIFNYHTHLFHQFVELSVLGEEGEPVGDYHGLAEVVQKVGGGELSGFAVGIQKLVGKERSEMYVL